MSLVHDLDFRMSKKVYNQNKLNLQAQKKAVEKKSTM